MILTPADPVHEVRPEDTLAGLALKYDVTVEEIRRTNSLWANDNVWPGQVLRVPVAATQAAATYQGTRDLPGDALVFLG